MLLRRKKIIIITFILMQINDLSTQVVIPKNNSWLGIIFQNKLKYSTNMVFDVGFRTFDLLSKRRNVFGRFFLEKSIKNNFSVGGGYALFENFSFGKNNYFLEHRPFTNMQIRWKNERSEFFIRNRNEWRIYASGIKNTARYRFQFTHEYAFSDLKTRISYEYLKTSDNTKEHRYTVGIILPINQQRINLFYAINRQTSLMINNKLINQHVFGIQLQIIK